MSWDHYVSLLATIISLAGLILVIRQLRDSNLQRQLQSLVSIYDVNRQLLILGFTHPKLFLVLADSEDVDPVWERYYLQLWLNQFALIHSFLKESVLKGEFKESLIRDISDFFLQRNMRNHWLNHGAFYPKSFQKLVDDIIRKTEPPMTAAQYYSGA